jgi:hypothetical protein
MSVASYKREFRAHPNVNPETGRTIKVNGDTYNQLVEKYGRPTKRSPTKRSPTKRSPTKRSPTKRSPTKRSPKKSPTKRSPISRKDPFAVLSDESILNVLHKLNEDHRMKWVSSSPTVRRVYEMNF